MWQTSSIDNQRANEPITTENQICKGRSCALFPNTQLNFKDNLAAQPPLRVSTEQLLKRQNARTEFHTPQGALPPLVEIEENILITAVIKRLKKKKQPNLQQQVIQTSKLHPNKGEIFEK